MCQVLYIPGSSLLCVHGVRSPPPPPQANRGSVAMGNSPEGEGEETQMLKDAFEQLLYFTEDLDHASGTSAVL